MPQSQVQGHLKLPRWPLDFVQFKFPLIAIVYLRKIKIEGGFNVKILWKFIIIFLIYTFL